MWLYERDSDAPSVSSEPGGKQWQHIYGVSVIDKQLPDIEMEGYAIFNWVVVTWHNEWVPEVCSTNSGHQSPVLLLQHDAVAILLMNGFMVPGPRPTKIAL